MEKEAILLQRLQRREKEAFRELYTLYGEDLLLCAYGLLKDTQLAPEKVESLFRTLWNGTGLIGANPPLYKHLFNRLVYLCQKPEG